MKVNDFTYPLYEQATPYDGSSEVIYHGTNVWFMSLIIASNSLMEGAYWGKPDEPHGPRLTESYKAAKGFIEYASPDWPLGGILVLNTASLMKKYKLVSYVDKPYGSEQAWGDEQEVAVITPAIKPLEPHLASIHLEPSIIKEAMDVEALKFAQEMWGHKPAKLRTTLTKLSRHPKMNKNESR